MTIKERVKQVEIEMIQAAGELTAWKFTRMLQELGLTPQGLYNKLDRYGLRDRLNTRVVDQHRCAQCGHVISARKAKSIRTRKSTRQPRAPFKGGNAYSDAVKMQNKVIAKL